MNKNIVTIISNESDCLNIVFNEGNESIILLCNTEKEPTIHRIEKSNKINHVLFEEIESKVIKEHIEYYLNCMDSLLKLGKDFEYVNEFIETEILTQ